MKTLVLEKPGEFQLTETSPPQRVGDDEALVRVLRVGICGTDLHAFEGKQPFFEYPRILGHELAVEIVALGKQSSSYGLSVGDICAVEPYMNCGVCVSCRRGRTNCCVNLQVLGVHCDGGMREQITVPMRKLHLAAGVPADHLAMVEMLGIGAHAVRRAQLEADENVLVIGAGPIGLGVMAFAQLMNVNVIAMDINSDRLAFSKQSLNIEHTIDARNNPAEQLQDLLGEMPTVVVDATGSAASMTNAFEYVAHSGKLVYVGIVRDEIAFSDPHFHSHELALLSARNATGSDFDWVIESLASGAVNLDGWITHRATPEALPGEFAGWLKPENRVVKAMLEF